MGSHGIVGGGHEHVSVLLRRLRVAWLLEHFSPRVVWSVYVLVNGFLTIALLALLAVLTGSPFVFPSSARRLTCSSLHLFRRIPVRAIRS